MASPFFVAFNALAKIFHTCYFPSERREYWREIFYPKTGKNTPD